MFKTIVKNFGENVDLEYLNIGKKESNNHIFEILEKDKNDINYRSYFINTSYSKKALESIDFEDFFLKLSERNELKYKFLNTYGEKDELVEIILSDHYKDVDLIIKFYEDLLKLNKYEVLSKDTVFPVGKEGHSIEVILLKLKK